MEDKKPQSIADLFGLSEVPIRPGEKSSQVILQEVYDADMYQDVLKESHTLKDTVVRGKELLATFNPLLQDMFVSLFKVAPEILPEEKVRHDHLINKQLMETFFESEDFNRLRTMTQLDPLASALGTQVLGEKTLQQLAEQAKKKNPERQQSQPGNQDGTQPDQQQENQNDTQPEQPGNQTQPEPGNQNNNSTSENGSEKAAPELSKEELANVVTAATQETIDEMMDLVDQAKAWGIEPGDPSLRVSLDSKRKALERLRSSPKLQELTELIGSFKLLARQVFSKKGSDGTTSINSVTTGGDLEQVLPSEKMMLGNDVTKLDFLRRYHQKELLQYKSKNLPAGKGPMVVCCDVSGSMTGKPEHWSKATMLALAEVAQKQRRDFACILFRSVVAGTWIIPKGTWNPEAIIDMAEMAPSGGTRFIAPLSEALEIINKSRFRKADIVFITDGDSSLKDRFVTKFNQAKERKGFTVFTVLIKTDSSTNDTVNSFSDEVITLTDLAQLNEATAENLFNRVQNRTGA